MEVWVVTPDAVKGLPVQDCCHRDPKEGIESVSLISARPQNSIQACGPVLRGNQEGKTLLKGELQPEPEQNPPEASVNSSFQSIFLAKPVKV